MSKHTFNQSLASVAWTASSLNGKLVLFAQLSSPPSTTPEPVPIGHIVGVTCAMKHTMTARDGGQMILPILKCAVVVGEKDPDIYILRPDLCMPNTPALKMISPVPIIVTWFTNKSSLTVKTFAGAHI